MKYRAKSIESQIGYAFKPILWDLIPSSHIFAFAEVEVKDRMLGEREKVLA